MRCLTKFGCEGSDYQAKGGSSAGSIESVKCIRDVPHTFCGRILCRRSTQNVGFLAVIISRCKHEVRVTLPPHIRIGQMECSRLANQKRSMPDTSSIQLLDKFLVDMNELDAMKSMDSELSHIATDKIFIPVDPLVKIQNEQVRATTTQLAKRKNQSWMRRKEELHTLRQQTQEMETRVAFLQLQKEKIRGRWKLSASSMGPLHKWEATVSMEKQRLKKARNDNDRLKVQVRAYGHLLHKLQGTIAVALKDQVTNTQIPASTLRVGMEQPQQSQISSACIFNMLESIVDHRFQNMQEVQDQIQQKSPVVDDVDVKINGAADGTSAGMEYKFTQMLPFNDTDALNALWGFVGMCGIPQKQFSRIVRQSDDTYVLLSSFVLQLDQGTVLGAHVHSVMKRHKVPEGTLMFAESITNWSAYRGDSKLWSHESRESVSFSICRFSLGSESQQSGCQLNARVHSEATHNDAPDTHVIVIPFYRELIDSQRQFLENRIWDSIRAK